MLRAKLAEWLIKLDTGFSVPLLLDVYRYLQDWVRGHLMSVDCQLRGCVPARPPAAPPPAQP